MAANPNPARITAASWWLMEQLLALQPGTKNGGIYANKPGYHNTRAGNASNGHRCLRPTDHTGGPITAIQLRSASLASAAALAELAVR